MVMGEGVAETAKWVGSRLLLRRLRDIMAGGEDAQQRLDEVARVIARDMVAEVCSIYLIRPGDILELFATEGLLKTAVHRTRLRIGEGLVGDVAARARPLAMADAQSHPQFAYRPETGEEIYKSFLGVPLVRGGRVRGVLVVQNRNSRSYADEEIETLETVAMVMAELVAASGLATVSEFASAGGSPVKPLQLEGVRLNGGLAIGKVVIHQRRTTISQVVAENPEVELARFNAAVRAMHRTLDELFENVGGHHAGEEHVEILDAYRMFAEDRGWLARIREGIGSGLSADAAVAKGLNDTRARMAQIPDPYIRERIHDLEDLAYRLLQHLDDPKDGAAHASQFGEDPIVLAARSLGPAELLDYDRGALKAVILEEGSATAHVAIVARALGIPVVGRVSDLLDEVEAGDLVLVDGDNGVIVIRPSDDVQLAFEKSMVAREERQALYAASRNLATVTSDGVPVALNLNAGLLLDLPHLDDTRAEGIGLYRTEILFMMRGELPDVEAQTRLYGEVLRQAGDRPVVFRTLDAGGDKLLPYLTGKREENPAMGWRAIRMSLDRPFMLRQQLRALMRAASGRRLDVMFPMVADIYELDAARRLLDLEVERSRARDLELPTQISVGCMLEVPALLFQMPKLCARVDFLAVGSNDLLQFLFASDRGNVAVADRYDILSPAALGMLRSVVRECNAAAVPVSLCGEMAGQTLEAMALFGIGFRSLSMAAPSIGPVRLMIRSLDAQNLTEYMDSLIDGREQNLRGALRAYARDHGVAL